MKTKVILTLCVVFVLGQVSNAIAQMRAGSPEDKAYTAIEADSNAASKAAKLLDFEKQFPDSKVLPQIYLMLIDLNKSDPAKVIEYGEKAIKLDPDNVQALMAVSRNYSMEKKNLDRAVQYAQRAVDGVGKMRGQQPPPGYSDDQWKGYLDSLETTAKSLLSYAKSIKP